MVLPLTIIEAKSDDNSANEIVEAKVENEDSRDRWKTGGKSTLFRPISLIVLHVLDTLFLIALLPFIIWQCISASHHLKTILKAVVAVTLELLMWMIFAGVSVLMTTTFVVEDMYFQKNGDHEKLKHMLNTLDEPKNDNDNDKNERISDKRSATPREEEKSKAS